MEYFPNRRNTQCASIRSPGFGPRPNRRRSGARPGSTSAAAFGMVTRHVDPKMAEGVAWKFAPVRLFPTPMRSRSITTSSCGRFRRRCSNGLTTATPAHGEDVQRCLGQFSNLCDCGPVNSAYRGIPPGFDLERVSRKPGDNRDAVRARRQGFKPPRFPRSKMYTVSTRDVSIVPRLRLISIT